VAAVILAVTTDIFVVRGSGVLTTQDRDVSDFYSIALSGQGTIIIDQTGKESLKVTAEDNLIDRIETAVVGNVLKIELKKERFFWSFWPTKKIEYHISVDDLNQIVINGSGTIETDSLKAQGLSIRIRGSGNGDMKIEAADLWINISGSGKLVMSGYTQNQTVNINGSGNYESEELESEHGAITINGSGKAVVEAVDELVVNINGNGNIKYLGDPMIDQQISGSGKVSKYKE